MDSSTWIKNIVKKLTSEKGKNYSYLTIFFLTFSFFIFAAIRPSLVTAFSLKREEVALREINANYEDAISKVIAIQQGLERLRDNLPLLSQAIPERPNVNKLIEDVELVGARHSVTLTSVNVGDVNLKEAGSEKVKTLTLEMEAESTFPNLLEFLNELSDQRRIKLSNDIAITKGDSEATQSSQLKIKMNIEGYHL